MATFRVEYINEDGNIGFKKGWHYAAYYYEKYQTKDVPIPEGCSHDYRAGFKSGVEQYFRFINL